MEKQKKDQLIAVVLVTVCVFLLWNNVFSKKTRNNNPSVSSGSEALRLGNVNVIQQIRQNEKTSAEEEALWRKDWGRDPFVLGDSSGGESPGFSDLVVSGIVWDKMRPLAVINGEVHTVGDAIKGHTILEIKESAVVLSTGQGKTELPLFRSNQKRPAAK